MPKYSSISQDFLQRSHQKDSRLKKLFLDEDGSILESVLVSESRWKLNILHPKHSMTVYHEGRFKLLL